MFHLDKDASLCTERDCTRPGLWPCAQCEQGFCSLHLSWGGQEAVCRDCAALKPKAAKGEEE